MDDYIENVIYKNNKEKYKQLLSLNNKIMNIPHQKKPFLIEFLGTVRSGKSSSIEMICDVFRKNGLEVTVVDEEYIELTKNINKDRNKKLNINSLDYTNNIIEEKILIYDKLLDTKTDIIIFDRGINDEFIWLKTFAENNIDQRDMYDKKLGNRMIDELIILTCSSKVAMERKYFNSLSILPSKWTNVETMKKYIDALDSSFNYFEKHSKNIFKIDSSDANKQDIALKICEDIIKVINN